MSAYWHKVTDNFLQIRAFSSCSGHLIIKFWLKFHTDLQALYLPFFFCETCQSSALPSENEAVRPKTIYSHYGATFPALFKMPITYDEMLWFTVIALGCLIKTSISPLCIILYLLLAGLIQEGTTLKFMLEYLHELFPNYFNFIQPWVQAYSHNIKRGIELEIIF